jgi:uncharacterized damage-inducible protein DinB
MNTIIDYLQDQLRKEATTTRNMLKRVPEEKLDWQPHPKSMSLVRLATHVAEIPGWIPMVTEKDELNFAQGDYQPHIINTNQELVNYFEQKEKEGEQALSRSNDDILGKRWVMRGGDEVFVDSNKGDVLRMCLSQIIHHRAQLGVYLRLLDIPIPGSYGPSADEQ